MIGSSKKKILLENACVRKKRKPELKFNHRLALIDLRTTGSRSHFILSRWSMIIRVSVLLNTPVVDIEWRFDNLCGSHLQSQS